MLRRVLFVMLPFVALALTLWAMSEWGGFSPTLKTGATHQLATGSTEELWFTPSGDLVASFHEGTTVRLMRWRFSSGKAKQLDDMLIKPITLLPDHMERPPSVAHQGIWCATTQGDKRPMAYTISPDLSEFACSWHRLFWTAQITTSGALTNSRQIELTEDGPVSGLVFVRPEVISLASDNGTVSVWNYSRTRRGKAGTILATPRAILTKGEHLLLPSFERGDLAYVWVRGPHRVDSDLVDLRGTNVTAIGTIDYKDFFVGRSDGMLDVIRSGVEAPLEHLARIQVSKEPSAIRSIAPLLQGNLVLGGDFDDIFVYSLTHQTLERLASSPPARLLAISGNILAYATTEEVGFTQVAESALPNAKGTWILGLVGLFTGFISLLGLRRG